MKTKLSTRIMAWFVVSVLVISALLVIPVSGEWTLNDLVLPDGYGDKRWQEYWSWEQSGTGIPDPDDATEGMPHEWNDNVWTEYCGQYNMSFLDFETKSQVLTTAKAGDVVWLKVALVLNETTDKYFESGVDAFCYCITFDDSKALPFMMPLLDENGELNTSEWTANQSSYRGEVEGAQNTWFALCFQPTGRRIALEDDYSFYMPRYNKNNSMNNNFMLGLHINTESTSKLTSDPSKQAVWYFPMQLDEDLADGEKVNFTIPYPQQNISVQDAVNPVYQLAKGGTVSITIDNTDDVDENVASGNKYSFTEDAADIDNKNNTNATNGKLPLVDAATNDDGTSGIDVVNGSAYGKVDFRGPADINSVSFTFNAYTADKVDAALPTKLMVYGVKPDGEEVLLGTATSGTAVYEGVANDENVNVLLDPDEGFYIDELGWDVDDISVVNESSAYKYTIDFDSASYVGIRYEVTAAEGKDIALGEIEAVGEYSKFEVTIEGGVIENASSDNMYTPGDVLDITATVPADENFNGWSVKEGEYGSFVDASEETTKYTVGAYNATIVANTIDKTYTLTVVDGEGSGEYAKGTTVNISAPAETVINGVPHEFLEWEVAGSVSFANDDKTLNETTVVTDGEATLTPVYTKASYNLKVENGVVVSTGENGAEVEYGDSVEIKADAPDVGWEFAGWTITGDDSSYIDNDTLEETSVTVFGEVTVTANYVQKKYTFDVVEGIINMEDVNSEGYISGTKLIVIADEPKDGEIFDKWIIDSGDAIFDNANSAMTTVTTTAANTTIIATYKSKYTLEVINGTGSGEFAPGEEATIKADVHENPRYGFFYWKPEIGLTFADGYDIFDEEAVLIINEDTVVEAVYHDLYADGDDNLAIDAKLTLLDGAEITTDALSLTHDKLYPLFEESVWPMFQSVDGKVSMLYELDGYYSINKVVLNSGWLTDDLKAGLPNGLRIYGIFDINNTDERILIKTVKSGEILESYWDFRYAYPDVYPSEDPNTLFYDVDIEASAPFKYIVIEYDCTFKRGATSNEKLMLGEAEIYGEEANFIVQTSRCEIESVISGTAVEREDGYIGYTAGTVLQLKLDENTDLEEFDYFSGCSNGILDEDSLTFTVGTGDAMISANFVNIHADVPENLAPGATMQLSQGTLTAGSIGTASNGWYDGGYISDELYPLTYGARWTEIQRENGAVNLMFDLGGQYDISSLAFTFTYGPGNNVDLPNAIEVYASNSLGEVGTKITNNSNSMNYALYETVQFNENEDVKNLESCALRLVMNVDANLIASYRYITIKFTCTWNRGGISNEFIKVGEVEIYGVNSQFTIKVEEGSMIPQNPDNLYSFGNEITISANTIPNKEFIGWTINDGADGVIADPTATTTTFTVGITGATITANYKDIPYLLTVVYGQGGGMYIVNTPVTITADTPDNPEEVFDKWIIRNGSIIVDESELSKPEITIITNGEATIEATYKDRIYLLTVEEGTGSGNYTNGSVVTIVADDAGDGRKFDKWIIDTGDGTFADASSPTTTFTTTNEPTTIRATYVNIYDLTVENGSIAADDVNEDGYVAGEIVDITAPELADKKFIGWVVVSGDGTFGDANSATTTFTTGDSNTVIKADYADILYDVTVKNGEIADDDYNEDGYIVRDVITVVADEAPIGWEFDHWQITGDCTVADDEASTTELTVASGGCTIEAIYKKSEYTVTVENGIISGEAKEHYNYGDVVTIIANTPADNTYFTGWTLVGEGSVLGGDTAETTVTVGTGNVVVTAGFANEDSYEFTIVGGTVVEGEADSYYQGDEIVIVADEVAGKEFVSWTIVSGEGASIDDVTSDRATITVGTSDVVVHAEHKDIPVTPATGDRSVALYIILALVTLCGATMMVYKKKAK